MKKYIIVKIILYILVLLLLFRADKHPFVVIFIILLNEFLIEIYRRRKKKDLDLRTRNNRSLIDSISGNNKKLSKDFSDILNLIDELRQYDFIKNISGFVDNIANILHDYTKSHIVIIKIISEKKTIHLKQIIPDDYDCSKEINIIDEVKNEGKIFLSYRDYLLYSFNIQDKYTAKVFVGFKENHAEYKSVDKIMVNVCSYLITTAYTNYFHYQNIIDQKQIEYDLQISREIQNNLLPSKLPDIIDYKVSAFSKSAYMIGGDYYDVKAIGDGKYAVIIADVAGKGISAALYMSMLSALLENEFTEDRLPNDIVTDLNRVLVVKMKSDFNRFITLFLGILDTKNNVFSYTNAGHNPPNLLNKNGKNIELSTNNMMLGVMADEEYVSREIKFEDGDCIIFYTDGLTEISVGQKTKVFNLYNDIILKYDILSEPHTKMKGYLDDIISESKVKDDVTILILERTK